MRLFATIASALLMAGACGSGGPSNRVAPRESAAPAGNRVEPATEEVEPAAAPADPGLAGMSPSRRRAYDRGYRDCAAGRYDPERYPEAYRIGCAAAQDRRGDAPPEG